MRIRTAVAIAVAFVTIKAALTGVALSAWGIIPQHRWPVDNWHIELGSLAEWLAASATASAAAIALFIAGQEGRRRRKERDDADHAQARLVLIGLGPLPTGDITVTVTNYGDRSILDVTCERVEVEGFPSARFTPQLRRVNVIEPNRDKPSDKPSGEFFRLRAADESTEALLLTRWTPREGDDWRPTMPLEIPLAATVRFTDANGNRWETTFVLQGPQATRADGSTVTIGSMRRGPLKLLSRSARHPSG